MAGKEWTPVLRGLAGGLHFPSMETRLWPDLPDKHRWALELMEKR